MISLSRTKYLGNRGELDGLVDHVENRLRAISSPASAHVMDSWGPVVSYRDPHTADALRTGLTKLQDQGILKVLSLTHRVPWPPDRGDRITTYGTSSRHLVSRGARQCAPAVHGRETTRDDRSGRGSWRAEIEARSTRPGSTAGPAQARRAFAALLTGAVDRRHRSATTAKLRHDRAAVGCTEDPPDLIYVYSVDRWRPVRRRSRHRGAVRVMQFAELDSDKWRQFARARALRLSRCHLRRARRGHCWHSNGWMAQTVRRVVRWCPMSRSSLFQERIGRRRADRSCPTASTSSTFASAGDARPPPPHASCSPA